MHGPDADADGLSDAGADPRPAHACAHPFTVRDANRAPDHEPDSCAHSRSYAGAVC
jgi:hypothetical protein